ncbi:MAG: hypothetical protein KBB11_10305 [Bacteroidales bacterium]|nr:hypothetical protein [Bacteroidales bacterium]HOY38815.1 hypothetical protein [Bacteroidales bacterium]HQP04951.1 hypothetical protein [Bacteroidales bacterium]
MSLKQSILLIIIIFFVANYSNAQYSRMYDLQNKQITQDSLHLDSIVRINFSYIPWDIHDYGAFTENEIRYFQGKTSYFSIVNQDSIKYFVNSFNILNLSIFEKENNKKKRKPEAQILFDPRMVIDFIYKSGRIETLLLDRNGNIYYDANKYFTNIKFNVIVIETVPPAERKWWEPPFTKPEEDE